MDNSDKDKSSPPGPVRALDESGGNVGESMDNKRDPLRLALISGEFRDMLD